VALYFGEMGSVRQVHPSTRRREMLVNDNRPSRDKVRAEVLSATIVAEQHLGPSLRTMLQGSSVSREVQDGVQQFVQPLIERLRATEALVIDFTREPTGNRLRDLLSPPADQVVETFNAVLGRLKGFAEGFSQQAVTQEQQTQAAAFTHWVEQVAFAWQEPTKAREKDREGQDLERE